MEYKFFTHFIITYSLVLGSVIGWFVVMFRKGKSILNHNKIKAGNK